MTPGKYRNRLDRCFALFPSTSSATAQLSAAALQVVGDTPFTEVDTPLPAGFGGGGSSKTSSKRTALLISDHFGLLGSVHALAADSKQSIEVNVSHTSPPNAPKAGAGASGAAIKTCLMMIVAVLSVLFWWDATSTTSSGRSEL